MQQPGDRYGEHDPHMNLQAQYNGGGLRAQGRGNGAAAAPPPGQHMHMLNMFGGGPGAGTGHSILLSSHDPEAPGPGPGPPSSQSPGAGVDHMNMPNSGGYSQNLLQHHHHHHQFQLIQQAGTAPLLQLSAPQPQPQPGPSPHHHVPPSFFKLSNHTMPGGPPNVSADHNAGNLLFRQDLDHPHHHHVHSMNPHPSTTAQHPDIPNHNTDLNAASHSHSHSHHMNLDHIRSWKLNMAAGPGPGPGHDMESSSGMAVFALGWTADETAALITIRSSLPEHLQRASLSFLSEELSRKLEDMGYQKSPQECKEKLESLQNNYKQGNIEGGHHNILNAAHHRSNDPSDFSSEGGHARNNVNVANNHHLNLMTTNQLCHEDNIHHLEKNKQYMSIMSTTPTSSKRRRETSLSADEDEDEEARAQEFEANMNVGDAVPMSGKPNSWMPSKRFFQKLSRQIIERQEDLHRAFLEAIEAKERERAVREEAYRRQEAARLNREHDIRAQEVAVTAARDAALIAFLEKAAGGGSGPGPGHGGHGEHTRHMLGMPNMGSAGGGPGNVMHPTAGPHGAVSNELCMNPSSHMISLHAGSGGPGGAYHVPPGTGTGTGTGTLPAASINFPGPGHGSLDIQHHMHHEMNSNSFNPGMDPNCGDLNSMNTRRWPKAEVHALIRLRSGMEPRFREAGPKAHLWQEISASMACLGFIRSPKRCKEKWENINKYFKKTKDSSKKRPENAKTCPYFHQLDTLYERGILTSSSSTHASKLGKGASHENLLEYNTKDQGHEEEEEEEDDDDDDDDDDNEIQHGSDPFKMQHNHHESMSNAAADPNTQKNASHGGGEHEPSMNSMADDSSVELGMKFHHLDPGHGGNSSGKDIATNDQQQQQQKLIRMLDGGSQAAFFPTDRHYNAGQNQGATATTSTGTGSNGMIHVPHHEQQQQQQHLGTKFFDTKIKSMQVEMFVKDILDLQQQQHQKLVDEYDRMEQAHELRDELEKQHHIKSSSNSSSHGPNPHSHEHHLHHHDMNTTNTPSSLMAFVHKLGGASHDDSSTSTSHDLMAHAPSNVSRIH